MDKNINRLWIIIACGCLSAAGAMAVNLAPIILGSAADQYGFLPENLGYFISLFLLGFAGSIIATFFVQSKLNWHYVFSGGVILGGTLFVLVSFTSNILIWNAAWLLAGVCCGPVYALVVPVLAKLPNASRGFGGKMVFETGIPFILLLFFPSLLQARFGYTGVAFGMLVVMLAIAFVPRLIPKDLARTEPAVSEDAVSIPNVNATVGQKSLVWIGIIATCIYFGGQISAWSFLERHALVLNYTPADVGVALSLGKLGAMVGALAAVVVAGKLGRFMPQLIAFLLMISGYSLFITNPSRTLFIMGAFVFEFAWTFLIPYMLTQTGELDTTKKLLVFIPAAQALGGAYGPALAGNLVSVSDYSNVFYFGLTATTITFVVFSYLAYEASRQENLAIPIRTAVE